MRSFAISLICTSVLGLLSGAMPVKPVDGSLPVVPPSNASLPANASLPVPPKNGSFPAPPVNGSFPIPPKNGSFPAPPKNGSFPAPPVNGSLPAVPANTSASASAGAGGLLGDLPLATVIASLDARSANASAGNASQSIEVVWTEMWTEVAPLAQSLLYVNKQNGTADVIKPILGKIIAPLNATLNQLVNFQHLGLSVDTLLTAVGGVEKLTVGGLAGIVGGDLSILFKALGAVTTNAASDITADLVPIVTSVGILVGQILTVVLSLVTGLLASLGPILVDVGGVLNSLGLGPIFAALGIKL
ncbi:hypothetical protein CONPUDRAFT_85381 [Coniophora puteana RWD-64-598 SS2]|uniref:Uncharacterized protein n=1 Tax=Coniophora puteana (strain RWD-64-598) TaxID=741705 RepID=A0A5M3M9B1_CONPW|nr:uncharacterized protein CONPUDRAFT_85381 [Coniophora puteana RWD-64-598 SS2]EIW75693.1 hypothetical protein CONPUDRAFT_85381 [Coniophora puteana RWD-64-598 SS2]